MENKNRTATEVLISVETKLDQLMHLHRSLDLNIKVLSNKLNQLLGAPTISSNVPNISLPTNDIEQDETFPEYPPEPALPPGFSLPVETSPVGFRRTSRPETFAPEETMPKKNVPTPAMPIPEMHPAQERISDATYIPSRGERMPVMQRVVDKNGKAIFMAEVEIVNNKNHITELKTRTNGVGKWQASLAPGQYKVFLRKAGAVGKPKMEIIQDLVIDGSTPNELQMMIVK
jgi:hypothetical protein